MKIKSFKLLRLLVLIIISIFIILISIGLINKNSIKISESQYIYLEKQNNLYLEIDKNSITNTSLKYKIYNNTNKELYYGVNYEIEFLQNDKWKKYNILSSWIDLAVILKPNSTNEEKVEWKDTYGKLSKGKYRIIKNVNNIVVFDEFEIK